MGISSRRNTADKGDDRSERVDDRRVPLTPSISSRVAFDWTFSKILRSNIYGFILLFLHVQVPDEDASIYASPEDFKILQHRDKGVSCEAWIKKGDPKEVICHEVKQVQPDFLVVGSRGLGPFQRIFVGTVCEFCAKHAECPVTIKRPPDEAPQYTVVD